MRSIALRSLIMAAAVVAFVPFVAEGAPPKAAPKKAAAPPPAAKAAPRALFDNGLLFKYQKEDGVVWAHKSCARSTCPLVIFLHGSNKPPVWPYPSLDERFPSPIPDRKFMVHVGKMAQKMIDAGKVTPLVIAAPTNGGTGQPWASLDLKSLVGTVVDAVRGSNVTIDLDQVGVVGHSAAGGYPGRGLDRVAAAKATFDGHELKVFGITDTNITQGAAANYAKALKSNRTTAIYALHKMGGGWTTGDSPASNTSFGKGLEANHKMTSGLIGYENAASLVGPCLDNDGAAPLRMTCKIDARKINGHHAAWAATGGYKERPDKANEFHNDMVPLWAWWALPRFYPKQ